MSVELKNGKMLYTYLDVSGKQKKFKDFGDYFDESRVTKQNRKVIFLNKNGYDSEREFALKQGLVKNGVYDLEEVFVGRSSSEIKIKGFYMNFNSVMFDDYVDHFEVDKVEVIDKIKYTYFKNTTFIKEEKC